MADELHVDSRALRASGERLIALGESITTLASGAIAGRRTSYGHPSLEAAGGDVSERWRLGLEALAAEVAARGHRLLSVAGSYEDMDAAAAAAARSALQDGR